MFSAQENQSAMVESTKCANSCQHSPAPLVNSWKTGSCNMQLFLFSFALLVCPSPQYSDACANLDQSSLG